VQNSRTNNLSDNRYEAAKAGSGVAQLLWLSVVVLVVDAYSGLL
jgi:hypothetical protein